MKNLFTFFKYTSQKYFIVSLKPYSAFLALFQPVIFFALFILSLFFNEYLEDLPEKSSLIFTFSYFSIPASIIILQISFFNLIESMLKAMKLNYDYKLLNKRSGISLADFLAFVKKSDKEMATKERLAKLEERKKDEDDRLLEIKEKYGIR